MTQITSIVVACAIQLLTAIIAYQYLAHRVDGKLNTKEFLKIKYDFIPLLVMLIAFFASTFVFLVGFLWNSDGFMRAWMNAEVMLWLAILGYIDARERIIPNGLIGIGLLFWLGLILIDIFVAKTSWLGVLKFSLFGGGLVGGVLLLLALLLKNALGMGDVKLFFVLGLLYGVSDAYAILLFSIIVMAIISLVLLAIKKVTIKTAVPMAPFVVLGFILCILAGM